LASRPDYAQHTQGTRKFPPFFNTALAEFTPGKRKNPGQIGEKIELMSGLGSERLIRTEIYSKKGTERETRKLDLIEFLNGACRI
jgi:hypothetical protein